MFVPTAVDGSWARRRLNPNVLWRDSLAFQFTRRSFLFWSTLQNVQRGMALSDALRFASAKLVQSLLARSYSYLHEWYDRCTFTNLPVNHWDIVLQVLMAFAMSSYFTNLLSVRSAGQIATTRCNENKIKTWDIKTSCRDESIKKITTKGKKMRFFSIPHVAVFFFCQFHNHFISRECVATNVNIQQQTIES